MRHELKTDPKPFQALWNGEKLFEIRKDDRVRGDEPQSSTPPGGFQVGDDLLLCETRFSAEQMKGGRNLEYTGREVLCVVTHKLTGYGLQDGWCILGIKRLELRGRMYMEMATVKADQPAEPKSITAHVKTRDPLYRGGDNIGEGSPYAKQTGTSQAKEFASRGSGWSIKPPPAHWIERFGHDAALKRMHSTSPLYCMGDNCFSDGTTPHSPECIAQHERTTNPNGKYDRPHSLPIDLAVMLDGEGMPYCAAHGRTTHVVDCKSCEVTLAARCCMAEERRKKDEPVAVDRRIDAKKMSNKSGGHVSYYSVDIGAPSKGGEPYRAEAIDVIAALDMTFAEGEALKAVWRCAADRIGAHKDGNDTRRDAEKVAYYGEQMFAREKKRHG